MEFFYIFLKKKALRYWALNLVKIYQSFLKKEESKQKIISIDIASGINGNNGKIMGISIKANSTYTLHAKKTGHTINHGKRYSGKINIIDIGIKERKY